jgi:hypothetical protein
MSFEDEYGEKLGYVRVIKETPKAILVKFDGADIFDEPEWFPKSQIHDDSEVWREGQEGELIVTEWFAEQRG